MKRHQRNNSKRGNSNDSLTAAKKRKCEQVDDEVPQKKAKLINNTNAEKRSDVIAIPETIQANTDRLTSTEDCESDIMQLENFLVPQERYFLRADLDHENILTKSWLNSWTLIKSEKLHKKLANDVPMSSSAIPSDIWKLILDSVDVVSLARMSRTSKWHNYYYNVLSMERWKDYFNYRGWRLPHVIFNSLADLSNGVLRRLTIDNNEVDWIGEVKRNYVTEKRISQLVNEITDKIRRIVKDPKLAVFNPGMSDGDIKALENHLELFLPNDVRAYLKCCSGARWKYDRYTEIGFPTNCWEFNWGTIDDFVGMSNSKYYPHLRRLISDYQQKLTHGSTSEALPTSTECARMVLKCYERYPTGDEDSYDDTSNPTMLYDPLYGCFQFWNEHYEPAIFGTLVDLLQFFSDALDTKAAPMNVIHEDIGKEHLFDLYTREQLWELPADPFEMVVFDVLEDVMDDYPNITPRAQAMAANAAKQFLVDVFSKAHQLEKNDAVQPDTFITAAKAAKVIGKQTFARVTSNADESIPIDDTDVDEDS